jgi:glutamyl-tRNA reductase
MGAAMALGLAKAGGAEVLVANRTWERSQELAARVGGRPVRFAEVPDALGDVDVLLSSTGAASTLLAVEDLAPVMAARPDRPLLVVDIAVPRDIDSAVGELAGVTLLDMDDLRAFAEAGAQARRAEVTAVRRLLDRELDRYLSATSAREVAPLITALRDRAEAVRVAELDRHQARLAGLDDRQLAAVESLTRGIVAKLLHEPSLALRDAAGTARGDRLVATVRDLFFGADDHDAAGDRAGSTSSGNLPG